MLTIIPNVHVVNNGNEQREQKNKWTCLKKKLFSFFIEKNCLFINVVLLIWELFSTI